MESEHIVFPKNFFSTSDQYENLNFVVRNLEFDLFPSA